MANVLMKKISKAYGSVQVLNGIDLEIEDGEFVVLVGPSGCGKSTLLRLIAGLEDISSGQLSIDGRVVNDVEARDRDIAMVFQSYALYPHMSVAKNIGFPLSVRKRADDEIATSVDSVAQLTGLDELLERKPRQLSGGQRQRVAMGRAIVRDPKVFLFDEPLSNLDAKLRVEMRKQIRDLHRRVTATSVYVTHDQVEAMTLADRVVLMKDGLIQQVGSPMDLYNRPLNTFVAGFIGSPEMNFLDGRVVSHEVRPAIRLADDSLVEPDSQTASQMTADQTVLLGVRPEHVELGDQGLAATVVDFERLGSETRVFADVRGQTLCCVLYDQEPPKLGTAIQCRLNPERLHVFDKQSGKRI